MDSETPPFRVEDALLSERIALEAGLLARGQDGNSRLSSGFVDKMLSNARRGAGVLAGIESAVDSMYPQLDGNERLLAINLVISVLYRASPRLYAMILGEIRDRPDTCMADAGAVERMARDARVQRGLR